MERKITSYLNRWKKDIDKKVLLLYGNKQIGKTYSVLKFGEKEYKNIAYFDSENNKELLEVFKNEKNIDKIIMQLSLLINESIMPFDTLIVIDNVNDIEIVNAVKNFSKGTDELKYHIILISSLRESINKFKCEELQFKAMHNVDFEEYLVAVNNRQLIEFIKTSYKNDTPMPFHSVAMDFYNDYLITGGYPEAIEMSLNQTNKLLLNTVYNKINNTNKKEFANFDNYIDMIRAAEVFMI